MEARLFVYGTLRRGESAAHLLEGARYVGKACIQGLVGGEDLVAGELYEAPVALFEALDQYEGPGYARKLSEVRCGEESVEAWVYWLLS
jgi:gamma-glutamylcyclotransferase (GGCT)/AIG2-like uncharacterized protein YtfP